jgi:hypothetical protein
MLEIEAKTKKCPFGHTERRWRDCITASCMAWVSQDQMKGYCSFLGSNVLTVEARVKGKRKRDSG